jgi:hypothetical protein
LPPFPPAPPTALRAALRDFDWVKGGIILAGTFVASIACGLAIWVLAMQRIKKDKRKKNDDPMM